jgi:tRNA dimethylallyltransferase
MAKAAMKEIYGRGHIPVLTGGTGFYIQAVLYDIDFEENGGDNEIRQKLEERAQREGVESLHRELEAVDPKAAEQIHENNIKRVIRALEYYQQTGKRISEHNEEQRKKESAYNQAYFVLTMDREQLYHRIDRRVDLMMEEGLLEEVKNLLEEGVPKEAVSMQGLGYKEMVSYLSGECSLEEAVYILKRDTRHFAKRQLTWFRREKDVVWVEKNPGRDLDEVLGEMMEVLKERNIRI